MDNIKLNVENLSYLVENYSHDIVNFYFDVLNFETLDDWQVEFLEACQGFGEGGKMVAVAACHGPGKTYLASGIPLFRLLCYPEAQTKITSATESQLKQAFRANLEKIIANSVIPDWFVVTGESVKLNQCKNSWVQLQAWSANRPESFAGVHCESPCLIVDEASGVDKKIFESFDGSMGHPNSLEILLGNPLRREGELFDAFHSKKEFYHTITVSAHDSSFVDKKWIKKMADYYGEDSDQYRVRVLGKFPRTNLDSFISHVDIEKAVGREIVPQYNEPIIGGLDVGRSRDASVLILRRGNELIFIKEWNTRDSMVLAVEVSRLITEKNVRIVVIDANGIGAGCYDRLNQLAPKKVIPVSLAKLPNTEKEYSNGRARLWGKARDWLKYGSIPDTDAYNDLVEEGPSILYGYDKSNRYLLERKEDALKRHVSSPDNFDAFAYTFGCNPEVIEDNIHHKHEHKLNIAWQ